MHFEGTEKINGRDMTLYPGESFELLKDEIRGLGPPVNLRKIEVQWGEEPRDPNPTRITGINCAEVTQDLKQRMESGIKDELVVYLFKVGDTQSEEKEFEARCRDCHVELYAHNCNHYDLTK